MLFMLTDNLLDVNLYTLYARLFSFKNNPFQNITMS